LFITQGFLEDNTKPDPSTWDFFNGVAGPKRAWFGMWDHVRGNEVDAKGRLKEGRPGFFDEVMRFYDQHLKGEQPTVADPALAVQTSDGSWRAESQWPPADSRDVKAKLKPGTYVDHGQNNGTNQGVPPNGDGVWTFSPAVPYDVHLAGVPSVDLKVETQAPDANLVVDVYDLDASNNATLISRGAYLVPKSGAVSFQLYGDDWVIKRSHRIGVLLTSSNTEWWAHAPTGQTVSVTSASIALPFLTCARTEKIAGDPSVKLESYMKSAPFAVDKATVDKATDATFALPPEMGACAPAAYRVLGTRVQGRAVKPRRKHAHKRAHRRTHKKAHKKHARR
jgi:predicted acyl esterase